MPVPRSHTTDNRTTPKASCVVLLSGGVDSAVTLALARRDYGACAALSVEYGQRHSAELIAAGRVARHFGVHDHRVVRVDLRAVGGSALTADMPVPKSAEPGPSSGTGEIPVTYVPARNMLFLALGVGLAEALGAGKVCIGVNAVDYSGYPDCRPEFIEAFERASALATRAGVEGRPVSIVTPIVSLSKAEIIRLGARLGVPFELTHSCYDPVIAEGVAGTDEPVDVLACGQCDACRIRREGFRAAGIEDPTRYAPGVPRETGAGSAPVR
jgi:7-cyano-7-deazaguanine synthase